MKITFDNNNTNQNVDKVATTTYRETARAKETHQTGGYALDISGTVMDNSAYKGQGKTTEDVMQEAGQIDVASQTDYLTVMSKFMSPEDYSRMLKDGYHVGEMQIEEVVTIIDKIKAELIRGGTQISGYTDQIDEETLEEITGSEAFARELDRQFAEHDVPLAEENVRDAKEAYDRAAEIQDMSEGAVKYMVENHREPTIEQLYLAEHSAADGDRQGRGYYADEFPGYYAKKADEYHWQQLQPQMEKILQEAGLPIDEDTLDEAKWLVEKGIPLTPEAVSDLHQLNSLKFPQDMKQILSAVAAAIADGKSAGAANLADNRSNLEKAAEYVERFGQISDDAVDRVAEEGEPLTLKNLEKAETAEEANAETESVSGGTNAGAVSASEEANATAEPVGAETYKEAASANEETYTAASVTARRQLEEVRLMMTIEANRKLIESGYSIDTMELERLVDTLKQIEAQQKQLLFGGADVQEASEKAAVYTETRSILDELPYYPIDIAGRFKTTEEDFTLRHVQVEGGALRDSYESAREKYETLMTAPRADMGDSIRKAFRNVDDILEDMDLETNEENRRAIRILGYNHMELSEENIQAVKESDRELRRVIQKMTPAATLQTIRDGVNPLEMTITELNDYLDSQQSDREEENEKYSKFLYKLEKNQEIDNQEREAYIGIYRMFRQLEKTDDAAIGTLLQNGAELSFKNLLGAVRSNKRHGMDYTIDDAFAGVDGVTKGISISEQIEGGFGKYYRRLAGDAADRMAEQDAATQRDYQKEQLQEYRELGAVEEAVVNELLNSRQPVTPNALLAADMLMNRPGFWYKKLNEWAKPADKEKVRDAAAHLQEAMADKESAQEAYQEMEETYAEILDEAQYDADIQYLDLKAMQSCRKQLTLAGNLAQEENYHIPVEIHGEMTAIHLKVLHGREEGGKVKATLSTESYGKVAAEFTVRNRKVSGYIACSTQEGTQALRENGENLRRELQNHMDALVQKELELGDIGVLHSSDLDLNQFMEETSPETSAVQTADLYQVAKAFIRAITS
ncbi:MAG: DUF6240 domain-containing protein [Muribaculaceae bacterium]|nr:DUF6240 domain-containing protein [Muribaculaceae bacterium]